MSGIVGRFSASLVGLALLAAAAGADDKLKPEDLPKKVQEVVKMRFPGAEFTSITKEKENGKDVYDIEMKFKGKKAEMDIEEDGTIHNTEMEIDAKDLPAAVSKALEEKYPKAKILEAMEGKDAKDKVEAYEVIIETADKKKKEVELAPDGKIIKEEDVK